MEPRGQFGLFEFSEKSLLSFLHQVGGVKGPRELLCYLDSQKFEVIDTLHLLTIYVDEGVGGLPGSPEVHHNLLGFCGVQDQILSGHH